MGAEARDDSVEARTVADLQHTLTETLLAERERAMFLARASRTLSSLLNTDRTVARVLGLAVPRLGAWAAVALRTGGTYHVVTSSGTTASVRSRALDPVPSARPALARPLLAGRTVRLAPLRATDLAALFPVEILRADAERSGSTDAVAVPLRGRGESIGVLTVMRSGDGFDDAELELVEDFAERAATAIESARLFAERSETAAVLERSLRPEALPDIPGLRLGSFYGPTSDREIGGDFYDLHGQGRDWSLALGDVSGNGIEAAVLTGRARDALRTAGLIDRTPSRMLALTNAVLHGTHSGRFVTILCARLRPEPDGSVRLDLASAGHPSPVVRRADGHIDIPEPRGTAAGIFPDRTYPEVTVRLGPGDACLFYTDGITEARNRRGELFGEDRLHRAWAETSSGEPQAAVDFVAQQVVEHLDGSVHDDLALLAAEVAP